MKPWKTRLGIAMTIAVAAATAAVADRPGPDPPVCYDSTCGTCSPGAGAGHRATLIASSAFPSTADGSTPISFVDPNDGRAHRFVVTQQGRIWVWNGWKILPTPFL